MPEELGTRTETLKSVSKLLHEYREDFLETARYHDRLAQEVEQATLIHRHQKQPPKNREVSAVKLSIGSALQSGKNQSPHFIFIFSQAGLKTSQLSQCSQDLLAVPSMDFSFSKQDCHCFSVSPHLCCRNR